LNVVSEFNLDNTTVYSERKDENEEEVAEVADGDADAKEGSKDGAGAEKMEIEDDQKE
jgi:hypothetical protein